MRLEDFIGLIEEAGLAIGVEEILDAIWLGSQGKVLTSHRRTDQVLDIAPPHEPNWGPPRPDPGNVTIPGPGQACPAIPA